ncbi:MAG: anthranilate synthase component I [Candidatus Nanopelagicales bacterium]
MTRKEADTPSLEQFCELAAAQRVVPVSRTLLVDHVSAIGLFHALCGDRAGTFLLESAEAGVQWSRYSFIGVHSAAMLTESKGEAIWTGRVPDGLPMQGTALEVLEATLEQLHTRKYSLDGLADFPFTGGLVGYMSYDIVRQWEGIGDSTTDSLDLPDLGFLLASDIAIVDHLQSTVTLIANAINFDNSPKRVEQAYADSVARLDRMQESLAKIESTGGVPIPVLETELALPSRNTKEEIYLNNVDTIKEYIRAGDAFQVVLSQRFSVPTQASALSIYRILRSTNPSPYMYLVRVPNPKNIEEVDFEIIGSSPEALVTIRDQHAVVHPIAGTRWRSADLDRDRELAQDLLEDKKERAEHLMLVDLARNDLGRVCTPGSVNVVDFMHVERYSHVMHLVSTVTGDLAEGENAFTALRATFPAGTLSGAPKPRAMQIIEELEFERRGLYGGCVGYFDFAGNLDMAIAIRTALLKNGNAHIQAGGGIVADSVPAQENDECINKAMAVIRAVALAEQLENWSR